MEQDNDARKVADILRQSPIVAVTADLYAVLQVAAVEDTGDAVLLRFIDSEEKQLFLDAMKRLKGLTR